MLQLRQGRQRGPLHHGARAAHLSRSPALAGTTLRHRSGRTGANRRGAPRRKPARKHAGPERLGRPLFCADTHHNSRRPGHRPGLPAAAKPARRHHPQVSAGIFPPLARCPRTRSPRTRIFARTAAENRPGLRNGAPRAPRPLPWPRHLSHPFRLGAHCRLWRTHSGRKEQSARGQICQLARVGSLPQGARALRALSSQARHRATRPLLPRRRLHGRALDAPKRRGKRRGLVGHVAHRGADTPAPSLHRQRHRALRRRRRRHQSQPARHRHASLRGAQRACAPAARRPRPRQLCPRQRRRHLPRLHSPPRRRLHPFQNAPAHERRRGRPIRNKAQANGPQPPPAAKHRPKAPSLPPPPAKARTAQPACSLRSS